MSGYKKETYSLPNRVRPIIPWTQTKGRVPSGYITLSTAETTSTLSLFNYNNKSTLFMVVAICRGGDSGSWSNVGSQTNQFAGGSAVRLVIGFTYNASADPVFTRSGTSAHPITLVRLEFEMFPGPTPTWTSVTGAYTGDSSTSVYVPAKSLVHIRDRRFAVIAIADSNALDTTGMGTYWNLIRSIYIASPMHIYVFEEIAPAINSTIPLITLTAGSAVPWGTCTFSVENYYR